MNIIINLGMDVHTTNYTLCCYTMHDDKIFAETTVEPDYKNILKYMENVKKQQKLLQGYDVTFRCGYEAGGLGYTLYHQLTNAGIDCVILAPSTIPKFRTKEIKTDKRDARKIAKCLAYGTYSAVYIPTAEDLQLKEYIRMRDDQKDMLKRTKQQILSLCLREGHQYRSSDSKKNYWTEAHMKYLRDIRLEGYAQEALDEYMLTYVYLTEKIERLNKEIEKAADSDRYREKVKKLQCFIGIKTYTAMTILVETGDFSRFPSAEQYASYLGLTPGEHSSSDSINRLGITKAGNSHIRKLLVEASQGYGRGKIGYKSKELLARQKGNKPEIIDYADKANVRLRKKYYHMVLANGKKTNVAKTAIARELACFIWGMMTGAIGQYPEKEEVK